MNHDRTPQKITIEDLLRLKRAERPPAEFWAKFESDLRAKQLAAIVDKQPWWHVMPRAFTKLARLHLPLGATAVVAATVFTVGGYRVVSVNHELADPAIATVPTSANLESPTADSVAAVVARTESAVETTTNVFVANSNEISEPSSLVDSRDLAADVQPTSAQSAHAMISGSLLAEAQQVAASDLATVIARTSVFEARATLARARSEPLAQVRTPKDDRRERYLGRSLPGDYAADVSSSQLTSRPADVLNRHFNERRFQESDGISRFGAYGAGVSIKL